MEEYLSIFKALSDETRLRIVCLLMRAKRELCVCEVANALNESHYNVSRHFKILERAGLVKERKEGRWVFYSLIEPKRCFYKYIVKAVSSIRREDISDDYERLKRWKKCYWRRQRRLQRKVKLFIDKKEEKDEKNK